MKKQHVTLMILEAVFAGCVVAVALLRPIESMEWWLLAALPFAVMRGAVTLSENEVFEWLREPFCEVVPDSCGAGDSVVPRPGSVIGKLLCCPICTGTWVALALVALIATLHPVGVIVTLVLGGAGASEFLYYAKERNSWGARLNRVRDGKLEAKNG